MFSAHCSTRNTFRSSNSCFFASSSGGQFLVSAASAAALAASRSFALTFSRERSHKKRHSSAALRRNRAPAGAQNKKSGIVPAHPAYIAPGTVTQEPSPAVIRERYDELTWISDFFNAMMVLPGHAEDWEKVRTALLYATEQAENNAA